MWCFERMAWTIWGITVSSYPTMPGKSGSLAFNIRSRFSRTSARTVLRAVRASVKWLRMRAPRVVGLFRRFSFAMISPYLQTQGGSGMVQSSLRGYPCQRLSDTGGGDGRRCDRSVPAKSAARDPDRGAQAGCGGTGGGRGRLGRQGPKAATPLPPPRLILVRGVAGSGKSELAKAILKQISAVYLDNNFLADAFSPGSRSDESYLAIRDNLYAGLYRITGENLRIGNSVLLDAPHIRQAQDPEWCRWIQDLAADAGAWVRGVLWFCGED